MTGHVDVSVVTRGHVDLATLALFHDKASVDAPDPDDDLLLGN